MASCWLVVANVLLCGHKMQPTQTHVLLCLHICLCAGIASDRFTRFNHHVKLTQLKAQQKLQKQTSDVAHFDHSLDFLTQLRINKLCHELQLKQP